MKDAEERFLVRDVQFQIIFLNEWGIDIYYVPFSNEKFIKMFKSVITFFYYYERILSEVKSKIDDEIDFLINEDDESEENKQRDGFVCYKVKKK